MNIKLWRVVLFAIKTNKHTRFHPFRLLHSKTETGEDYAFLFQTIKDLSLKLCADDFKKVLGNVKRRIVCWAHVERKIEENIKGIGKDIKQKIVNVFGLIQSTASEKNIFAFNW
ncbi:hypothetical protein BpHYR1_049219 [Brachionus plicatilis]|uniref:MULE transposase domain-containing protein n=1 Tax=Brachionus plicatilis TaxID=10195 RepID=A0A3M7RWW7_BRAPC|nr:hypothetical protein BpHYR1_049219 [Brachionus plicatilis]